jgi:hypothetical protein
MLFNYAFSRVRVVAYNFSCYASRKERVQFDKVRVFVLVVLVPHG